MVARLVAKGVKPSQTYKFPNWVDLNLIYPQPNTARDANPYCHELDIASDKLVLMYSGSMNKKQGLDLLVQVIHQLSDLPQIIWLLAGEGPTKADLVAATQGLSNVLHLPLQPIERLNDWLNIADIHVLPQKAEAADLVLPSKLLGILASGRPVVATSTPGSELASIVSKVGYCVNPGDAKSFSLRLRDLILDSQLRLHLGKQARSYAENILGKNHILSSFEQQLFNSFDSRLSS